jgi:hypothetical protein
MISDITRLGLYNDALTLHLGERRLAGITENTEPRRILDAAWDRSGQPDGGPIHCLELGYWNFATVRIARPYLGSPFDLTITYELNDVVVENNVFYISLTGSNLGNLPSTSPGLWAVTVEPTAPIGFLRAFIKPSDWLRTAAVSDDPYFNHRLENYADEGVQLLADMDVLYLKYISRSLGLDQTRWTMAFAEFVSLYLADHAVRIAKTETRRKEIRELWELAKKKANNIDAQNKPTATRPLGQWAASRLGGSFTRLREG